jgi:phytoene dehydrogenase-like protein
MDPLNFTICGGGVGGVSIGALLSKNGQNVALFERLGYLGGCSGTFGRNGNFYNAGATTFVGLSSGLPLDVLSRRTGVSFPVVEIDPAIVVHIMGKTIRRFRNMERFVLEMENAFPGYPHRSVFQKIRLRAEKFWLGLTSFDGVDQGKIRSFLRPLFSRPDIFLLHSPDFFRSTLSFLQSSYGVFPPELKRFFDHQLLITAQGFSDHVPLFAGILGLTYPNLDNYTVMGGMGRAIESLSQVIPGVYLNHPVKKIQKKRGKFLVTAGKDEWETENVILNRTIWDLESVLDQDLLDQLRPRLKGPDFHDVGAFVIYFMVEDVFGADFELHHQIILDDENPVTKSQSFFLSLSHPDDPVLSRSGMRSVTISTHTPVSIWEDRSRENILEKRSVATNQILESLYRAIPLFRSARKGEIISGTPKTFEKYTGRSRGTVGGIPVVHPNFPFRFPSSVVSEGIYLVGDTVFPGQGWPGVVIGALNLFGILRDQGRMG